MFLCIDKHISKYFCSLPQDPYVVVKVCHHLEKEGINQYALQVALEYALRDQWEELAWVLLKAMKEAGVPLREHYFWPLLHLKAIAQEPAGGCICLLLFVYYSCLLLLFIYM